MSTVKLLGYSERGILNAVLYEILYAKKSNKLLAELIGRATFPFTDDKPPAGATTVFVEQSLSDFGDSDAIVLIEPAADKKCAIFIEAKVNKKWESISQQFLKFEDGLTSLVDSWNIFTQIYHKQQFVRNSMDDLKNGIPFPAWSTKRTRKIGAPDP